MKNAKTLTRGQKELLESRGYDYREWLRVKDQPGILTLVHRATGRYLMLDKEEDAG